MMIGLIKSQLKLTDGDSRFLFQVLYYIAALLGDVILNKVDILVEII